MKRKQQQITRLSKLMSYILRHRPDEFGLVLDEDGFVILKEFIKAINEEPGWSYVRLSHIEEVLHHGDRPRFEIQEKRIRAHYGHSLPVKIRYEPIEPPKVLYHGTRQRTYPVISQGGLQPMGRQYVHLTTSPELALRIGRRSDKDTVLLTIQALEAHGEGIVFYRANELIYLVEALQPKYISGPSLPKEIPKKPEKEKRERKEPIPREAPGSFFPDIAREIERVKGPRKKDGPPWKTKRRRHRKLF